MRLYIAFLLLVSCSNTSFTQDDGNEEKMIWQKSRRLTWDDYKGKRQKRFAAASTVYSMYRTIYVDSAKNIIASVKAVFYPKDSWKGNYLDDALLAHEQRHFDIVELYARKLRKQLGKIKVKDKKDAEQKLDSLHAIIDKEMDAFQDKYDKDTDYSMARDEQQSWIQKIDAAIESLVAYQNTEVRLKKAF
jgi:uncharacterized protein DUF922